MNNRINTVDPDENLSLAINDDLITCPLTYCLIQHPILASDGQHYELCAFYEMIFKLGNTSPITRQAITHYIYDRQLKKVLDEKADHHEDRYEPYDEKKFLKLLSLADDNFVYCPITKKIMRHPVLASDGYHYELQSLLEFFQKKGAPLSPKSLQPIYSIIYDSNLKSVLDGYNLEYINRFPDYDKTIWLHQLTNYLNKDTWKCATIKSISAAGIIGCTSFLLFYNFSQEKKSDSFPLSLHLALCSGVIDYLCRIASNRQYGLFGLLKRAAAGYMQYRINDFMDEAEFLDGLNHAV